MVKEIKSLEDVSIVIDQNPQVYSLGGLVREIVDLNSPGLYFVLMEKSKEERDAFLKTIEGRLNTLYLELDRRERCNPAIVGNVLNRL